MSWWKKAKSIIRSVVPSKHVKVKKVAPYRLEELKKERSKLLWKIGNQVDQKTEWICHDDCDGFLWEGKFRSVSLMHSEFALSCAEGEKGKFYRTPSKDCYSKGKSGSTWSRDMGVGFLWWVWRDRNITALHNHIVYGDRHNWKMGDGPLSRVQYTPQLIGLTCRVWNKITGEKRKDAKTPYIYSSGLRDYQAHLQCLVIALEAEINGKIPKVAWDRVKEHFFRKGSNPLYAVLQATFTGHGNHAFNACMKPQFDTYVRGPKHCKDIEKLFAIDLLIRAMEK
jgi:hypothetical protein